MNSMEAQSEARECLRAFFDMTGVPDEFVWRVRTDAVAARWDAVN